MKGTRTKMNFHPGDYSTKLLGNTNPDLFIHLEEEKEKKINESFSYVKQFMAHFENLFRIR